MNIEGHNKNIKHKAEIMAGLVFVMFLCWGCISQLHSPLTCQQAREAWQKNQQETQNSQQLARISLNRDTIHPCL
jgi:hypothetical protein